MKQEPCTKNCILYKTQYCKVRINGKLTHREYCDAPTPGSWKEQVRDPFPWGCRSINIPGEPPKPPKPMPKRIKVRRVEQYTLDGEILQVWNSAQAAAKSLGKFPNLIRQCCQGVIAKAYGYIWKYEPEE